MKDDQPWWVAKDVCDVLEILNPSQVLSWLDEDERNTVSLNDGNKGNPNVAIINESAGLYLLIRGSRKPEAKPFKCGVTHEVLPIIRKTGGYVANDDLSISTYLSRADEWTKLIFKSIVMEGKGRLKIT